mgnify:CR=1 FL=1
MTDMNLLVVEDEDKEFNHYSDWVEEFNERSGEETGFKINLIRAKTADEAHKSLQNEQLHGAIVDLNLYEDTATHNASGNKVIEEIVKQYRIPVVVVSGDTSNLKPVEDVNSNSTFFQIHVRDQVTDEQVFEALIEIFKTGILNIIGGKGLIEEKLSKVFWLHLSDHLSAWIPSESGTEKSLLRHTLNHLLAYLDVSDNDSEPHLYKNAEFYIKPVVKPYISSGDIVMDGNDRYVLLSPACDVEVRSVNEGVYEINASSLVLGKIDEVSRDSFIKNGIIDEGSDNASKREKALDQIIKGMNPKFLFFPDYMDIDAGIVNLQNLKTVDKTTYASYERVATVSRDYLKEIQSRFSSYYARPGQPDLDKRELVKRHKKSLSPPV